MNLWKLLRFWDGVTIVVCMLCILLIQIALWFVASSTGSKTAISLLQYNIDLADFLETKCKEIENDLRKTS